MVFEHLACGIGHLARAARFVAFAASGIWLVLPVLALASGIWLVLLGFGFGIGHLARAAQIWLCGIGHLAVLSAFGLRHRAFGSCCSAFGFAASGIWLVFSRLALVSGIWPVFLRYRASGSCLWLVLCC